MENISFKAIVAGLAIDIGGSFAVGIVLGIMITVYAGDNGGLTPENVLALKGSIYATLAGLLGAAFFTGLAGYVAARMARPDGIVNSVIVGVISVFLTLMLAYVFPGASPSWEILGAALITIPIAWAGGKIAARSE
jgi:hypothetical protein